jgi:hypothetical protein
MNIPATLSFSKLAEDLKNAIFKDEERYSLMPNCDYYGENARCLASWIKRVFIVEDKDIDYNKIRMIIHRFPTNKLVGYVYLDTEDEKINTDEFISTIRVDIDDNSDYMYNEIMLINTKAILKALQNKNYDVFISLCYELTKYIYRSATPESNQDAVTAITLYIDFMYNQLFSDMEMPHTYANKVYRTLLDTNYCNYKPVIDAIKTLSDTNACVYFLPLVSELLIDSTQQSYYTEEIGKGMVSRIFEDERFELVVPMIVKDCLQNSHADKILTTTLAHAPSILKYLSDEAHKEERDTLVAYIKEKVDNYVKDHPELADFKGFENNDKASYKPNGDFIVPGQKLNEQAILDAKKEFMKNRNKKN